MLNILPPNKKDSLRQGQIYVQVRFLCIVGVIVMLTQTGLLLAAQMFLQQWQTSLTNQASVAGISDTDRDTLQARLTKLSTITTGISSIDAEFNNPIPLIVTVVKDLPTSIRLASLGIDYSTGRLTMSGSVDDRTALITLQDQLIATQALMNIELPINDFTAKDNIPFTLNATITNAKKTL